jgi:cytochrome c2
MLRKRLSPDERMRLNPQEGASVYGEAFCASCHAVQNAAGLMVGGGAASVFDQSSDSIVLARSRLLERSPWVEATKKRLKMSR